jgi:hypothetical protein
MGFSVTESGGTTSYNPVDTSAYQQRIADRQALMCQSQVPSAQEMTLEQAMATTGFYNDTLGNVEQLRYGCAYPDLSGMMVQNPQMMVLFMMYQQMQMQTMMLMMMLMMRQNNVTPDMMSRMLSRGGSEVSPDDSGGKISGGKINDANKQEINGLLENAASKYGIPPEILKSIAWQESRWNPGAVGDSGKSHGMMQIYTAAHPDYNVAEGEKNMAYNVDYGAKLLRQLYDRYGSWDKAVEHYNGSGPMAQRYAVSVMGHAQNQPWLA